VKNWDTVAQPIQVSTKSRGLDHDASHRVAGLVRGLAIHMFNEHGKLDFSQQLTNMLQEVFAEVGEVAERTAEDADALGEIAERRKLSRLLDPISDLCKAALEAYKHGWQRLKLYFMMGFPTEKDEDVEAIIPKVEISNL